VKRQTEQRPKERRACDLRDCRIALDASREYPTLREGGRMFSGVRVFCCDEHREEYESRLVLAKTASHNFRERLEDRPPGVNYR
jgi:hypothetical protein